MLKDIAAACGLAALIGLAMHAWFITAQWLQGHGSLDHAAHSFMLLGGAAIVLGLFSRVRGRGLPPGP